MASSPFTPAALRQAILATPSAMASSTSQPAPADTHHGVGLAPYLAMALGNAADLGTTAMAMRNGATEANPAMGQSLGRIAAEKAAGAAGIGLLMHLLGKSHPGIAKALGYGDATLTGGLALHNIGVAKHPYKY